MSENDCVPVDAQMRRSVGERIAAGGGGVRGVDSTDRDKTVFPFWDGSSEATPDDGVTELEMPDGDYRLLKRGCLLAGEGKSQFVRRAVRERLLRVIAKEYASGHTDVVEKYNEKHRGSSSIKVMGVPDRIGPQARFIDSDIANINREAGGGTFMLLYQRRKGGRWGHVKWRCVAFVRVPDANDTA